MSNVARVFFGRLVPALVRARPHLASYVGSCIQVRLDHPDGSTTDWCLDFRDPERWSVEPKSGANPDATIRMDESRFESLLSEPIPAWAAAYGSGEIRIEGDLLSVVSIKGFFDHLEPSRLARWALKLLGAERALSLAARRAS
jgi:hypothetical protein